MLNCRFCNKIPNEASISDLPVDVQQNIQKNNLKYFLCDCETDWVEIDNDKELFNLDLFGRKIRTLNDFKGLIDTLDSELSYYTAVPIIKDCLYRINDWLVSSDDIDASIEDSYIQNQIKILIQVNNNYYTK